MKMRAGSLAFFLMAVGVHGVLGAGTIYVDTNGTSSTGGDWSTPTSLTNALTIATNGSQIWLAQGVYTNNATFTVQTNCTLYGGFTNGMAFADRNWTAYPTVLDGLDQNWTVVTVTGTNVTLDGLSISNSYGAAAHGIFKSVPGNITLANCRLVNHEVANTTSRTGLGGYFSAGSVLMTNCVVAGNMVTGAAGNIYNSSGIGIFSSGANLQLVDCLFSNNIAGGAGSYQMTGVGLYFNNGTLNALRTDFINNSGGCNNGTYGGAAVALDSSTAGASFSNCVFRGNKVEFYSDGATTGYGGAMYVNLAAGKVVTVANCTFQSNTNGNGQGGAIGVLNGTLNVFRTDFIGNSAIRPSSGGGAVFLHNGANVTATFSNCVFRSNVVGLAGQISSGGAIWMNMTAGRGVTVANCTFKDNVSSYGAGGAIYVTEGNLVLKNSILWTNAVGSGYRGREIYRAGGNVQIGYSCLGGLASPWLYGVAPANMSSVMTNNPLFASAADLHLQSPAGRWTNGAFVATDTAYSPCIDAGDPASAYINEPAPNGSRVNLGAYGNTEQASMSPNAAPQVADRGIGLYYTQATFSGELVSASAVIAEVGVCYGTNSVAGDTTNGWQYVGRIYPPQQTGYVFSVTSPQLLTNTTYYYRWYSTNAYGGNWTAVGNFTIGNEYPTPGVGGGSNVVHVKKDATGAGNGQDWSNACTTIASAYEAVSGSRTNIWIAGGVYAEGFEIVVQTDLAVIGGFAGTETNVAGRALTNAQGVVTNYTSFNGEGTHRGLGILAGNVRLDTLVFSNCPAGYAVNKAGTGGLTMNNCRMVGNTGGRAGGYFGGGSVLMTNCMVAGNIAGINSSGIGLYSSGANLQLVDCLVSNNSGGAYQDAGVGLYFNNGTLNVLRTDFINNSGGCGNGSYGGAGVCLDSSTAGASFSNCVFRGNVVTSASQYYLGYGGAIWMNLSGVTKVCTVVNCTFKDNQNNLTYQTSGGGAIAVSAGTLVLKNSIFYTNTTARSSAGNEIYANGAASSVTSSYCCFSGTNTPQVVAESSAVIGWGAGVITKDPLYASATDVHLKSKGGRYDSATGTFVTTDRVNSPCIDAGNPADPVGLEPMPNGHHINMGAYGGTVQASKTVESGTIVLIR